MTNERTRAQQQLASRERLCEEVIRTRLECGNRRISIAERGQKHDGRLCYLGHRANSPTRLEAADAGHEDVDDDEVRPIGGEEFERLLAARCGRDAVTSRFEMSRGDEQVLGGVVD